MTNIVPFRRKAESPEAPPVLIFQCGTCGSTRFSLVWGGEVECDRVLTTRRHFDPTEPEPAA